jgi:hypothetical protein
MDIDSTKTVETSAPADTHEGMLAHVHDELVKLEHKAEEMGHEAAAAIRHLVEKIKAHFHKHS